MTGLGQAMMDLNDPFRNHQLDLRKGLHQVGMANGAAEREAEARCSVGAVVSGWI